MNCYYLVGVFIAAGIYMLWYCSNGMESFGSLGNAAGAYYSTVELGGTRLAARTGERQTLYADGVWHIRSSDVPAEYCFRVTSDTLDAADGYVVYMQNPGRVDNLPAALGGLPARNGYVSIFNSGGRVLIEIVRREDAHVDLARLRATCLTHKDANYCGNEYTQID